MCSSDLNREPYRIETFRHSDSMQPLVLPLSCGPLNFSVFIFFPGLKDRKRRAFILVRSDLGLGAGRDGKVS